MIMTEKNVTCESPMRNRTQEKAMKVLQSGVASPVTRRTTFEAMMVQTRPRWSAVYPKKSVPTMPPA
jgi:hypothetical protein